MRRFAAPALVLAMFVALLSWSFSSADGPIQGVRVVPIKQFNELESRVTGQGQAIADLRARVTALEAVSEPTVEPTPTETPDPEPTEEPTPTPTPTPTPEPEPSGFPTRDSVGPDADPTTPYAGDCYFSADESGTVIDGKVVDCADEGIRFAGNVTGVVFRNSIIRGQMLTTGNTPGDAGADTYPRAPVFTVEDSKVIQNRTEENQDRAACCAHYVIKRSLMEGTHSGFAAHNNVVLEGNYITTNGTDSHSSGGRTLKNTVLRGNTITCKPVTAGKDGGCSAAAVFYRERLDGQSARAYNLTIVGNYFRRGVTPSGAAGGPWFATRFVDCARHTDCTGITFTSNQFDLDWGTDGGEFPFYAGNTWAGNTWADGQPANSGQSR
jgi:hypothetical protein